MLDCREIKEEVFNCIKKNNLGYNPEILKFNMKSSIKQVGQLKIDNNLLTKCNSNKLAQCLTLKYDVSSIDDKKLYEYYTDKFKDIVSMGTDNKDFITNSKNK